MIHGLQKLTLTHDSVTEALRDYLQKHVAADVVIALKSWARDPASDYIANGQTLVVEFEQRHPDSGKVTIIPEGERIENLGA